MGISFYNNWNQKSGKQFIWLSLESDYEDGVFHITAGVIGFGIVIALTS